MSYKLTYFPVRGLGENIRLLCADNGLPLTDVAVQGEQWAELKPKCAFGQLPMFHDGDLELVQSYAILRYLARKHGLYGSNDLEATLIDLVTDGQHDFRMKYVKLIYQNYEAGKEDFIKELPAELEKFEKLLKRNNDGNGFFVGNKISFADYAVYDILCSQLVLVPGCLDAFPLLKAFHARIDTRPGIQQYHQSEGYLKRPINGNGKQ